MAADAASPDRYGGDCSVEHGFERWLLPAQRLLDAIYAQKAHEWCRRKSGKFIILRISNDNAFDTSQYGYAILSDGSKPKWDSYKDKYAYFASTKRLLPT